MEYQKISRGTQLTKILVGLDIFRKLLYNDVSRKNQGGIIGKTMTQNTTKNDKREQCDTTHNALKIYLTRKKFTPYPVPPAHAPASVSSMGPLVTNMLLRK
jgi:hypothetical protein